MKLTIKPIKGSQLAFVETKIGHMDIASFLKLIIKKDGRKEIDLIADADLDHATIYSLLNRKAKGVSLRATFMLLDVLGYDVMLVKREGSQ